MTFKSRLLPALALLASVSPPALAADLGEIIPSPILEESYTPVEIGSGWYIRGDIAYNLASSTSGSYRVYSDLDPDPGISAFGYSTLGYDNFDFGAGQTLSLGVGYQYNSFLRGDITGGYWKREISGRDTDPGYTDAAGDRFVCGINVTTDPALATATNCVSTDRSSVTAWEAMANGYADLGTFVGITPYVGAGLGMTNLTFSNLSNSSQCVDAAGNAIAGCSVPTARHGGVDSWRLTWALMAGASYDLSKNMKLDIGYRYSRIQGGDMFGFDSGTAALGATGVQGSHGDLSNHQLKAGVRYSIW